MPALPSREPEIPLEGAPHARGEPRSAVGVAGFPQSFDLCRIRIDCRGEIVQRGAARDGVTRLADHLTGVRRDNRAAEYPATLVMDSDKSLCLIIEYGSIDI